MLLLSFNFYRTKKLFWDFRIPTQIKHNLVFLKYNTPSSSSSTELQSLESQNDSLTVPPPPPLEKQTSGSGNTLITPLYSSGTFGGGGIGKPLVLVPAQSTYPLTAKLRDDLLNKVKIQQHHQQQQQSDSSSQSLPPTLSLTTSTIVCDPKDDGVVLLSSEQQSDSGR